jgi:outer membrane protein OmpA-like peptidoglycan-associated protein
MMDIPQSSQAKANQAQRHFGISHAHAGQVSHLCPLTQGNSASNLRETSYFDYLTKQPYLVRKLQREGICIIQTGLKIHLLLPTDKFFYIHSDRLIAAEYPLLYDIARFIENFGPVPITVAGHTDNMGSPEQKRALSKNQARNVAAFLWSHGIPQKHIHILGRGDEAPLGFHNNPISRSYNRYIEILFAPTSD